MKKLILVFFIFTTPLGLFAIPASVVAEWEDQPFEGLVLFPDSTGEYQTLEPTSVQVEGGITKTEWVLDGESTGRIKIFVLNTDYTQEFSDWTDYSWLDYVSLTVTLESQKYSIKPLGGYGAVWYAGEILGESSLWLPVNQVLPLMNTAYGLIQDASTGLPLRDVKLIGKSLNSAHILQDTTSDSGLYLGFYTDKEYNLTFQKRGFYSAEVPLLLPELPTPRRMDVSLSPPLTENQMRIVLNWNYYPQNLNLRIEGTEKTGENFLLEEDFRRNWKGFYFLERTGSQEFEHESLLIEDWKKDSYKISIKALTTPRQNRLLSYSRARVTLYRADQDPLLILIPEGFDGNLWEVFEVQEGSLQMINRISDDALIDSDQE